MAAIAAPALPTLTYAVKQLEAASWRIRNFAESLATYNVVNMRRMPLDELLGVQEPVGDRSSQEIEHSIVEGEIAKTVMSAKALTQPLRPVVVDFVWQNKATTDFQPLRRAARVYNHLCGSEIFEDKAKLALLLKKSSAPENALRSFAFKSVTLFARWCRCTAGSWGSRLWVAKIPLGNSGSGVWILGPRNWEKVVDAVISSVSGSGGGTIDVGVVTDVAPSKYAVVVQEYVARPLLWHGRKLQFRVYAVITGDLSCWIYRHGMLQFCNKPYEPSDVDDGIVDGDHSFYDDEVHITNVCRNVANAELFVKEKPCDLVARYPHAFRSMKASLADLVTQAIPFLSYQRSEHHFEFIGVDFIVDTTTGHAHLIECNCPPNNTGSDAVGTIEDFHQDLCNDLLRAFVLTPVLLRRRCMREQHADQEDECGLWEEVRRPAEVGTERFVPTRDPSMLARNGVAWAVYAAKAGRQCAAEIQEEILASVN